MNEKSASLVVRRYIFGIIILGTIVYILLVGVAYLGIPALSSDIVSKIKITITTLVAMVGMFGVVPTLIDLRKKYEREDVESILRAFNFFRVDIINLNSELRACADRKKVSIPDFGSLKEMTRFTLKEMPELSYDIFSRYNKDVVGDDELRVTTVNLLNALEEFSANVVLSLNIEHQAYKSLRVSFLVVVESNAPMLYILRNFSQYEFPHLVTLYAAWKKVHPDAYRSNKEQIEINTKKIKEMFNSRDEDDRRPT